MTTIINNVLVVQIIGVVFRKKPGDWSALCSAFFRDDDVSTNHKPSRGISNKFK